MSSVYYITWAEVVLNLKSYLHVCVVMKIAEKSEDILWLL